MSTPTPNSTPTDGSGPVRPGMVPGSSGAAPPSDPAPSRLPQWMQVVPRPRSHWTPRYVWDRLSLAVYQWRHPEDPWLTRSMVRFLAGYLKPEHTMVEFGSGRSTRWFARRVGRLISIEHHAAWHAEMSKKLADLPPGRCDYVLAGEDAAGYLAPVSARAASLPGGKADVVLVDGIHRDLCAVWALEHTRPGGLILIDNANWFLPHHTRAPKSIGPRGEPDGDAWSRFHRATAGWRVEWTSDGVTDTAGFFVPG